MILSDNVLQKRVFKQQILDLHLKDFMIGQTTPYLNKFKNTLDIGAATGMYSSHFAEHSKSVICFEAVPPVYEQLIKIKEKHEYEEEEEGVHNFRVQNVLPAWLEALASRAQCSCQKKEKERKKERKQKKQLAARARSMVFEGITLYEKPM